ncbi:MAG: tetratricopeptide repeat protein [Xenococcaceae cyanobacterium MO_188.B32]|nr:tetratricopeptide repeat protein [Xenococcaceae cyanobacterium MO_188.B32]
MVSNNREKFQIQYQAGKKAFERGEYRQSVQYLEAAKALTTNSSRLGGEAQIWLVTAYQAAGQEKEAIALAQELATHPHPQISQQAKRLLYIMQAPQLKRPKEWMSEIPDLADTADGKPKYVTAKSKTSSSSSSSNKTPEPVDLSQVNTQDNQFIWVALVLTLLTFIGLFWFK